MESKNRRIRFRRADLSKETDRHYLITMLESYKADPMGDSPPYNEEEKKRVIQGLSTHPSAIILFCFIDQMFAGAAVCFETFATFNPGPCINIHDICILQGFRGMGLGRGLMNEIIRVAKNLNAAKVTLEVRDDNETAKTLYRSLGFAPPAPLMHFYTKKI